MGKPILYQHRLSLAVRTVTMMARESGIELEIRDVDMMNGEHTSERFLKMNPQHTVPTLDDNGAYIWDSHAIAVYLLEKYAENSPLYTKDPYIRARINQRLHFDSGVLFAKLYALVHPIYFGAKEMKQEHIDAVFQAYEMLNTFLKDDSYLVGDHLTIADISCVTTTSSLNQMVPIDPVKYPNIIAWIDRISQLPYYEELNAKPVQEYGDMVRGLLQKHQSE